MPLAKVRDLLEHATQHQYGIAAINIFNYESILWAVKAAEKEHMPIIIQFYPGFGEHIAARYVSDIACDMASKSKVQIAVHLDHSNTLEIAVGGIRDGFPSVMIDCSTRPFDENVAVTAEVVRTARIFRVDVEAELGHVGSGASVDDITNASNYTAVEDAAQFVKLTQCDALAIAVGNAHGAYVQKPNLDFTRISAIREAVNIPLVLHGCSDIPDDQIQKAVCFGISKFNIATEYDRAYCAQTKEFYAANPDKSSGFEAIRAVEAKMIDFVVSKLHLLNPKKISP